MPVAYGGGLELGGVVAVAELGAQEGADAFVPDQGAPVIGETAQEQVVVDAGDGGQPSVDRARPFVEGGKALGIVDEFGDVVDGGVDVAKPPVGQLDAFGEGQVRLRGEGGSGEQGAPGLVEVGEVVPEERCGEVGRQCEQVKSRQKYPLLSHRI
ncbi:hypothetical protein ACFPOI_53180 [Nonomuraea angiospora]|uniref:hypothetical protein n=1 Tax=Nonomuraea angiospora TaxID=46172 RepID=UPI001789EC5B|nr:hypothetical protein [Nonomuraea angiospora]